MAGFRNFQTGEVLTAANVNDFLMQQSVMKFADAAARDSALGTAVGGGNALREGMVAYLDDTDEVLKYDGTGWDVVAPVVAGIGSNVVQAVKTDTFTTTSTSFTSVTGMSVTITPSTATSKILIIANAYVGNSWSGAGVRSTRVRLAGGNASTYTGGSGAATFTSFDQNNDNQGAGYAGFVYLDSPATTSATTYTLEMRSTSGETAALNRPGNGTSSTMASSLIAIEVAA